MKTGFEWWLARQKKRRGPIGDFARDAAGEHVVPETKEAWEQRLWEHGACLEALEAFELAWAEWQKN